MEWRNNKHINFVFMTINHLKEKNLLMVDIFGVFLV